MSTTSKSSDILLLGATGYTGRLVTRYLVTHPQKHLFSLLLGARSTSKLDGLLKELQVDLSEVGGVKIKQVDVTNEKEVERVVRGVRVVINTVGPYAKWGTPVVRACAKHGVHYVDLTGETFWIKEVINEFDYLASKTGAIIVPSCGMDSIPSDISAFLSNQTLRSLPDGPNYEIKSSITGHKVKGGVSGGTLATAIYALENVDKKRLRDGDIPYALSPAPGLQRFGFRLLYDLTFPGLKPLKLVGSWFFMSNPNRAIVERSQGLLEYHSIVAGAPSNNGSGDVDDDGDGDHLGGTSAIAQELRTTKYGKNFRYDEFMVMSSKVTAFMVISTFLVGVGLFILVPPVRWLVMKILPAGEGPSERALRSGYLVSTNRTEAYNESSSKDKKKKREAVIVKSVIRGKGDPGYFLTSIMLSESALCLLLPSTTSTSSTTTSSKSSISSLTRSSWPLYAQARRKLPVLAREGGGVFTPATAFGSVLVERLRATGRFEFESGCEA
ncbi:hypothetical protein BDN72DRAFT_901918 [Pluteus cervinus]|uniref:Uncharacterized protein n=1 Tax=Pluteus cervinus TaxID=181527 RepID=A0ACD3AE97_9AGAR|nr:hypothetical protein BDN72DRAFT_901918 [Pluteus cervinus]